MPIRKDRSKVPSEISIDLAAMKFIPEFDVSSRVLSIGRVRWVGGQSEWVFG
jgi:hypothetical protein